jgi:hypothetical protein
MFVFKDSEQTKLVQTVASSSTFISSVAGNVKKYILDKFPKNYFKHIYVDTASTESERSKNALTGNGLNKISYPDITFSPEITIDDPVGIGKIPQISSPNLYLFKNVNSNYTKVVLDPNMKFGVYCSKDYITINFNVSIRTNSYIQNSDIVHYIKSAFQLGMFCYYNSQMINVEIPKTFVDVVSKLKGFDISTENGRVSEEEFLAGTGKRFGVVTMKTNPTTNKTGYFYNERTNLLITVQDLNAQGTISRESMAEGIYEITARVQVSTFLPNAFIMSIDNTEFSAIADDVTVKADLNGESTESSIGEGIYTMALNPLTLISKEMKTFTSTIGETFIAQNVMHKLFTMEENQDTTSINIMDYMVSDFKKAHAYAVSKNIDLTTLVRVEFYTSGSEVAADPDYTNMTLSISGGIDGDFVIDVYVNRALLESLLKAEASDTFFFADNAMSVMHFTYTGTDGTTVDLPVRVYSFRDSTEMASSDVRMSLRIKTQYGIGYIGLVREGASNASDYKICVGYDRYNNAIIRAIEKV